MTKLVLKKEKRAVMDNTKAAVKTFKKFIGSSEGIFEERSEELISISLALLTGQHVLMFGPPGTAKSLLAATVFKGIENSKMFAIQLNKYMTDDMIFGPIILNLMKEKGIIQYNTEGSLADCHFAYIDEFLDANGGTLRSMLEVLNERTFTRGRQIVRCPLHTVIATSNFYKEQDELEAVIDRFQFRIKTGYVSDNEGRLSMLNGYLARSKQTTSKKETIKKIPFRTLLALRRHIKGDAITIPADMLKLYVDIANTLKDANIKITDRRLCWGLDAIKAAALLAGKTTVTPAELTAAKYALIVVKDEAEEAAFDNTCRSLIKEAPERNAKFSELESIEKFVRDSIAKGKTAAANKDSDAVSKSLVFLRKALSSLRNRDTTKSYEKVEERYVALAEEIKQAILDLSK